MYLQLIRQPARIISLSSSVNSPILRVNSFISPFLTTQAVNSYRSNPLGLAEFTLSRKDPAYVGRAKEVQVAEKAIEAGNCPSQAFPEVKPIMDTIKTKFTISRSKEALVYCCSCNRTSVHKCNRCNLTITWLRAFSVYAVS